MNYSYANKLVLMAVGVAIIETIAQNSLKISKHGSTLFLLGLSFYILVGYFLHHAYHTVSLGRLNVLWSCFSIIIASTLGYFVYDEHYNSYNVISVLFALFAIYFANVSARAVDPSLAPQV